MVISGEFKKYITEKYNVKMYALRTFLRIQKNINSK